MSDVARRDWIHRLYFDAYFEEALVKVRNQTGHSALFAILNSLNEYWYQIGVMSEEGYLYHKERYRQTLVEEFKKNLQSQETPTLEQIKEQKNIQELKKRLTNVFEDWDRLSPKSKQYHLEMAEEHKDLPIAQKILAKGNSS